MTDSGPSSGPYVAAGFFCERVIEGKDGVLSVVRILDRFTRTVTGSGAPDFMPPTPIQTTLLISLKSGDAQGRHDVSVNVEQPSGLVETVIPRASVLFEGAEHGANLVFELDWLAVEEGLHWFDVLLDGARVTRVPLRIAYLRQEIPTMSASGVGH
jgi:hypothetical protein